MKEILKKHRIIAIIAVICLIVSAYCMKEAFEIANAKCVNSEVNRWIAIGSVSGGTTLGIVIFIIKDWYYFRNY